MKIIFFSDQASKCEYQNYQESLMARYYASFDSENIKEIYFILL